MIVRCDFNSAHLIGKYAAALARIPLHTIYFSIGGVAMKGQKTLLRQFAAGKEYLSQSMAGVPIVEIAGDGRVLIENHQGVTEYSRNQISAKTGFGSVCVCGQQLDLRFMSKQQLVICGRIDSVTLCRRKIQ